VPCPTTIAVAEAVATQMLGNASLLLLWTEPFRIGDEIKLDAFEGRIEEIQTRTTIIQTYDGRPVVIPNADLFTIPTNACFQ